MKNKQQTMCDYCRDFYDETTDWHCNGKYCLDIVGIYQKELNKTKSNITDIMIDDILETTDEEIVNETIEGGIDIDKEVSKVKNIFNKSKTAPKNNVQEGKPRMSLIPLDILEELLVPAYEEGIIKYKRESWRKGFNTSVMVDASLRHINEFFYKGYDIDESSPTKKHHLAGAIFSLISAYYSSTRFPELDDRQKETK